MRSISSRTRSQNSRYCKIAMMGWRIGGACTVGTGAMVALLKRLLFETLCARDKRACRREYTISQ